MVGCFDFYSLLVLHYEFTSQVLPLSLQPLHHLHEVLSGEGGVSWVGKQGQEKYNGATMKSFLCNWIPKNATILCMMVH